MRPLFVAAVVLALLAGPTLGTCGDCCPASPVPVSVSAAASCCGDCETTVGRSPDAVSLAAAGSDNVPVAVGPASVVVPVPAPPASAAAFVRTATVASPPLPPPRPLRL